MIATYNLFFIIFTILCKVTVQADDIQQNVSDGCKCGRSDDHSFRIVGGREAEPHSYPWMAAIHSNRYLKVFCGGALINDRYIITAGHCVKMVTKEDLNIILGLHDKELLRERKEGAVFKVDEIILNEKFMTLSFYDIEDIALLKLNETVKFTKEIKPLCLPTNSDEDYGNKTAQVIGWGRTQFITGLSSERLREIDLRVLPKEECKNNKIIGEYILDTMVCAYGEERDACQGDSGGPLSYETVSGKVELIGVVSWGIRCAEPGTPGIYTRITSYLDWIAKNTKDAVYCQNS